jgi:outer membrane lipoprotein-sorting protein
MKRLALLLAVLVLLAAPPASEGAAVPDPSAPGLNGMQRLQALVDRVKLEQKKMKTLEARFVQRQESSMLAAPEESTGTFSYAAPDRVRWEYVTPNPISVVIDGEQMTTWYRDLKRAEKLKVGRYSAQVFKYLGASGSMQTLLDYFTVTLRMPGKKGDPYQMDMNPRYKRIAKRMKAMTLWIDDDRYLPVRVKVVDGDGDVTEYELRDLKVNAQIPESRFDLQIPAGVETRVIDLDRQSKSKKAGQAP